MFENKPPPQVVALLWHHFCFYKNNKKTLIFTIVLPLLSVAGIYIIHPVLSKYSRVDVPACKFQTKVLPNAGLLDLAAAAYSADNISCSKNPSRSPLDRLLRGQMQINYQNLSVTHGWGSSLYDYLFKTKILYFPNTSAEALTLMNQVQSQYQEIRQLVMETITLNISEPQKALDDDLVFILRCLKLVANSNSTNAQIVYGFRNSKDLQTYLQNDKFYGDGNINLDLSNFKIDDPSHRFTLLSTATYSNEIPDTFVQDLLNKAIIESMSEKSLGISIMMKQMPQKCWETTSPMIYVFMYLVLPLFLVTAFILPPVSLMSQILLEKHYGLREYMAIAGVSKLKLKISWFTFYAAIQLPVILVISLTTWNLPGIFVHTNFFIILIIMLLYGLSQLSFAYFMASVLSKPGREMLIHLFITLLFFILTSVLCLSFSIHGPALVFARIASFNPTVPFMLALKYLLNMEEVWYGNTWERLFTNPNLTGEYSGVGEAMLWMFFDIILYQLLIWYLDHVNPGEFGIKKPPFFFLKVSHWTSKEKKIGPVDNCLEDSGTKPNGIIVSQLSKHYGSKKLALSNLEVSFPPNVVSAFLGENGAGKSTTINILVGMIPPTKGTATINGLSIHNQMDKIRKTLAFVPQYDIIYPSLTVKDHLKFFGWILGEQTGSISSKVTQLLSKLEMEHTKNTICTCLSGGEKRKLAIITALLSEPSVLLLDEPTSGIDPHSRRAIWDLISKNRRTMTTVLSTHSMEEAEILADYLVIISNGELKCSGDPVELKNKLGDNVQLSIVLKSAEGSTEKIFNLVNKYAPVVDISGVGTTDYTLQLPKDSDIPSILHKLSAMKDEMNILSFGVKGQSIEEVYFKTMETINETPFIEQMQEERKQEEKDNKSAKASKQSYVPKFYANQCYSFAVKKIWNAALSPSFYTFQYIFPLAIFGLYLVANWKMQELVKGKPPETVSLWSKDRLNALFIQGDGKEISMRLTKNMIAGLGPRCPGSINSYKCKTPSSYSDKDWPKQAINISQDSCKDCKKYCTQKASRKTKHIKTGSGDILYILHETQDLSDWILTANGTDQNVVAGLQIFNLNKDTLETRFKRILPKNHAWIEKLLKSTNSKYAVVWANPLLETEALNSLTTALIRTTSPIFADAKIIITKEVLLSEVISKDQGNVAQIAGSMIGGFVCVWVFMFDIIGIVKLIEIDHLTELKQLFLISGAHPILYWLTHLVMDQIIYMTTCSIVAMLIAVLKNALHEFAGHLFLIISLNGLAVISFTYALLFVIKTKRRLLLIFVVLVLLSQTILCAISGFATLLEAKFITKEWGWALVAGNCLLILFLPPYALVDAFTLVSIVSSVSSLNLTDWKLNLMDFELAGKRLLLSIGSTIIYFGLTVILELQYFSMNEICFCCRAKPAPAVMETVDPDVEIEMERMHTTSDDVLKVINLTKSYNRFNRAASEVSFGVSSGECFGLLGVNGAGKTTVFRMLTGFIKPTSGTATLNNSSMFCRSWKRLRGISYCPQEATFAMGLTVEQNLTIFGLIQGYSRTQINTINQNLLEEIGLIQYKSIRAGTLSGGNKRKLQLAIALQGSSSVLFLDEPTTGMDPGSKRKAWNLIQRAAQEGTAVVLTSHSMEECEALCTRLVIMMRGRFQCIGSVQYLKDKYGNLYTFKLKISQERDSQQVETADTSGAAESVKDYMKEKCPTAVLIEEHKNQLHYESRVSDFELAHLYKALMEAKKTLPVEEFTISQVHLEQVFLKVAETPPSNVDEGLSLPSYTPIAW